MEKKWLKNVNTFQQKYHLLHLDVPNIICEHLLGGDQVTFEIWL